MFKALRRLPLTRKLVLFIVATSVLPLLIVGLTSTEISKSIVQEEVRQYTVELMVKQKDYLELLQDQVEGLIANLASIEELKSAMQETAQNPDDFIHFPADSLCRNGYDRTGLISVFRQLNSRKSEKFPTRCRRATERTGKSKAGSRKGRNDPGTEFRYPQGSGE